MALTKAHYRMVDGPVGSVKDFGAVGDNVTDDAAAIQAAVTAICGAGGKLIFPEGDYRLGSTITFPNTSFVLEGAGPTATNISALASSPSTDLFDFSGCNGPAKHIKNISFNGPALGVFGGVAIKAYGNGFLFDNCWFRGIGYGIRARGSFINTRDCVAEYCFVGAWADDNSGASTYAVEETIWSNWTMYNNNTDFKIQGDNKTFTLRDANCIGTIDDCVRIEGSGNFIDGITVQKNSPSSTRTPYVIRLFGPRNIVNNVYTIDCGKYGVFFEGAPVQENMLSNLHLQGTEVGMYYSLASNNMVSNVTITNSTDYGVRFDTSPDNTIENFYMDGNDVGIRFDAANNINLHVGKIKNSTTSDFLHPVANSDYLYSSNVDADFSGVATITHKLSILAGGQKQVMKSAAPTAGTWAVGDICINSSPAVGSPKGWRCTVAGTPGTWVSEGNL